MKEKSFITFPPEFPLRIKEVGAGVEPLTVEGEGENASLPSISSNLVSSCPGQNKIARFEIIFLGLAILLASIR